MSSGCSSQAILHQVSVQFPSVSLSLVLVASHMKTGMKAKPYTCPLRPALWAFTYPSLGPVSLPDTLQIFTRASLISRFIMALPAHPDLNFPSLHSSQLPTFLNSPLP